MLQQAAPTSCEKKKRVSMFFSRIHGTFYLATCFRSCILYLKVWSELFTDMISACLLDENTRIFMTLFGVGSLNAKLGNCSDTCQIARHLYRNISNLIQYSRALCEQIAIAVQLIQLNLIMKIAY